MTTYKCSKCGVEAKDGPMWSHRACPSSLAGPHDWQPIPASGTAASFLDFNKAVCVQCGFLITDHTKGKPCNKPFSEACSADHMEGVELSLLFVVMGEQTVVKVEKGDGSHRLEFQEFYSAKRPDQATNSSYSLRDGAGPLVLHKPFADVRAAVDALEGEKPVPRIERVPHGGLLLIVEGGERSLTGIEFVSLETLADKPLPIWTPKRGEWVQLLQGSSLAREGVVSWNESIDIWRYILKS